QVKDAAEFATAPVGSGPFRYSKDKSKAGEEVVFEANPYYANRQGKIGLPRIREIHFIVSRDRQKDFTKGREQGQMCLLLDLPTDPISLDKAKAFLESAKSERRIIGKIALKFPEDDDAVAQACGLIQKQLKEIGLEIELAPRPRRQLRREVEEENNYDLAYY